MKIKRGVRESLWMVAGAVILLAVLGIVLYFRSDQNPAEQLAAQSFRLNLVNRIRLELAAAAEAEKSAVMALTDEDSQRLADQARAATATAEQARRELQELLASSGKSGELKLLEQFSQAFTEFQQIDKELLDLAVRNTNLKAFSLAFGPAADAVKEMDAALARLPVDDLKAVRFAATARIAALRLLASLPPHIAEESDQKMDAMEAEMTKQDREVRRSLDELAALPNLAGNADLKAAMDSDARFNEARAQILKLSRENTNVRSLTISLTQKRKVMSLCQDALAALQQAIQGEVIVGMPPAKPFNPRSILLLNQPEERLH